MKQTRENPHPERRGAHASEDMPTVHGLCEGVIGGPLRRRSLQKKDAALPAWELQDLDLPGFGVYSEAG